MLVRLILTMCINYLIMTVAGDEFGGNKTKHHDENNRNKIDLEQVHPEPSERSPSYEDLVRSIKLDDYYDTSEPDEIQVDGLKRSKNNESDIPPSKFIVLCAEYFNGEIQCVNNVKMFPEQVIMHQRYDPTMLTDDIALIRLRGNAPNSEYIRPIALPNFDIDNPRNSGVELAVAGWGTVYERGPSSPVMLDTTVNLVPFAVCRRLTRVPAGKVCAIGIRGQDACHGDSGGPLMAYHLGKYFLAGIVSGKTDYGECGSGVPTTYTNVYQYLAWIKQNMRI